MQLQAGSRAAAATTAGRSSSHGAIARRAAVSSSSSRSAARRRLSVKAAEGDEAPAPAAAAAAEPAAAAAAATAPPPQQQQQQQRAPKGRPLSEFKQGDVLEGRVVNVQAFGAFVDVGAEVNALVHVSQLADGFVSNVADAIKVGDVVSAKVLAVDVDQKRLALTRKGMGVVLAGGDGQQQRGGGRGGRGGGGGGGGRGGRAFERDAVEEEEEEAGEPNVAELDGLVFVVEDAELQAGEGAAAADLDPDEIEFADDIPDDVARELALALEDVVRGTVSAVDARGVTVSYALEDGTKVSGVIPAAELLAPAHMVEGAAEAARERGEDVDEYVALDEGSAAMDPAQYYAVGDEVACFVADVVDGKPVLTQRLPESPDDELAEIAALLDATPMEQVDEALLVRGLFAAAEAAAGEDDDDAAPEDGDALLEELDATTAGAAAAAAAAAAAGADEADADAAADAFVSAVPEELRADVVAARAGATGGWNAGLVSGGLLGLDFPERSAAANPSASVTGALLEASQAAAGGGDGGDDDDEAGELVGVSVDDTTFVPAGIVRRLGYKLVQQEESGAWEVVRREGAGEEAPSAALGAKLQAIASGRAPSKRAVDAIVADLLADDDEEDEAELPALARRNPVVAAAAVSAISAADVKALRQKTGAGMMDCKKALAENGGDADKAVEWLRQKGLSGADKKAGRVAAEGAIVRYIHPGSRLGVLLEVNCETDFVAAGDVFTRLAGELAMVVASSEVVGVSVDDIPADVLAKEREVEMGKEDLKTKPEAVRAKIVEGRLDKIKRTFALLEQPALRDNNKTVAEVIKEAIAATGENIQVRRFTKFNLGEGLEKRSSDFAAEVAQQTQAKEKKAEAAAAAAPKKEEEAPKAAAAAVNVSAKLVKELRDKMGAGMMDCKKALAENGGDLEAASEWLRKKGLASADKKAGRLAAEGAVVAYIHPGSRLGVLLEVNCETDFVAAGDVFTRLANAVAMQIAASPTVEYVQADEIPAEVFAREKEIEMGREDLQAKPEAIRAKIAEGRVAKLVQERVLLEQPYLLDQGKTVGEAVKEAIAACGENIQVRRFSRFVLGEGVEKKVSNLAEEVAAATGGKA